VRHIPVFVVSAADDAERGLRMGAIGCVSKPASRTQLGSAFERLRQMVEKPTRRLLVVDRDAAARDEILELIGNTDVSVTSASGIESLQSLAEPGVDCLVLAVRETGDAELELLRRLEHSPEHQRLPVVLFLDGSSPEIEHEVRRLGRSLVLKEVRSPERLLDETARFSTEVLAGRTVLIVGDDVRNIFAMTSLLERHGMQVISAENGSEALSRLESTPGIELVLMDVMLPGMDGYETTRAIRQLPSRASLPILALTAKAMKGDREKCLEAGASDYIAKPVEAEHLVAQLRSWLHR
jgi:CheY-like chemotaxis protein